MAVIVTQKANFGSGEIKLRVLLPKGKITKAEREKAEKLDVFLKDRMPGIEREMQDEGALSESALKKWHSLGSRLQFVDDSVIVDPSDLHEGRAWRALREYCPGSLLPKSEKDESHEHPTSPKREGKKYDHFELCYRLAKFQWADINWLPTWKDWVDLIEVPGLMRDSRIMPEIGRLSRLLYHSLIKESFREVIKELRKEFPTRVKLIDSTGLSDAAITEKVKDAFRRAWDETQTMRR